jgi:hypothetical protein
VAQKNDAVRSAPRLPQSEFREGSDKGGILVRGIAARGLYLKQCLVPTLKRADIVAEAIEAVGATLLYLPSYSVDLNPIELASSKSKAHPRDAAEHTILGSLRRIGLVVKPSIAENARISCTMQAMFGHDRNPL